ncbi:MAG: hypothetical protein UIK36_06045, partial [Lactococcus lactis]|nr:hypothetical protein [Lactococcus lactis]
MDRIKSICIEEELCQSHDGSLEQILKQMLSYKKLYNVILRAEKQVQLQALISKKTVLTFLKLPDLLLHHARKCIRLLLKKLCSPLYSL